MPIIVLTTAAGAPGASTTALGLTLSWPGPALLVEADPAGTSLVPGWFRGAIDPQERNIVNLALVERAEDLTEAIFDQAISIAGDDDEHQRLALLGLIEPVQAAALPEGWWEPIGSAFQALSAAGYAVIIDTGRITQGSYPMPLLAVADQVLLVCRAEVAGVLRSYPMAIWLKALLAKTGNADTFGVVAVGNGGNRYYSGRAVAKQLGVQFAFSLPDDPLSAAALSDGLALPPRLSARVRARLTRRHSVDDDFGTTDEGGDAATEPEADDGNGGGASGNHLVDVADDTKHESRPQPVGDQRELLLERTNQLLGGPPGPRSRGRVLTQPVARAEGIDAYLSASSGDSIDEPVAEKNGQSEPTEAAADVPRTIIVPPKLMRAYRSVARDSAHRAEQRLARLLADDPDR
ncbi:MAG TPA: hypothetical protein VIT65_08545 [Microlunatus sp.]